MGVFIVGLFVIGKIMFWGCFIGWVFGVID